MICVTMVHMAYDALDDEDMPALKALQGMTVWSLEALLEIKPMFT